MTVGEKIKYSEYRKSRNKEKFYEEHRAELTLYESALRILKEKAQGKKLPTLKMLREEKSRLTALQSDQREEFNARREYERELRTVCSNVDIILGTHQPQSDSLNRPMKNDKQKLRFLLCGSKPQSFYSTISPSTYIVNFSGL